MMRHLIPFGPSCFDAGSAARPKRRGEFPNNNWCFCARREEGLRG